MGRPRKYAVRNDQWFGKLKVVDPDRRTARGVYAALVQCKCGSPPKLVTLRNLVTGATVTCGCLQREVAAKSVSRPQVRRAMAKYRDSRENADRLATMNRSTEARNRPRAPKALENLTRWQQSPECSTRMAALNKLYVGSEHELAEVPDPDWCEHHNVSRYDHTANGRCHYPN